MITESAMVNLSDTRTGNESSQVNNTAAQHVVICGMCGAIEKPLGPHKTECPNCDDYIY